VTLRARGLTTISDSTSQKFVMIGQLSRKDSTAEGSNAAVFIDFEGMRSRKCEEGDKEPWYARKMSGKECVMGHKVDSHILEVGMMLTIRAAMVPAAQARRGLLYG
jgi:hypothetical protein